MSTESITKSPGYVGARIRRTEDPALLRGEGRYVDDIHLPGMVHAAFARSPHAHARILGIDLSRARSVPGVLAVLSWKDLSPSMQQPIPMLVPNPAFRDTRTAYCLVREEVCFVGEAVAVVIAESRHIAEDAAERIDVTYEPLPVVADARAALREGAALCHTDGKDNLAALVKLSYGNTEAAFAHAARVVRRRLFQHRGAGHPIEGRAVVAQHDPFGGRLTTWCAGQSPFLEKKTLVDLLDWDPQLLRVVNPDVGGGFGPKTMVYGEQAVVAFAAVLLKRPVKWIEDRREHFLTATQERDQYWDIELALDADARILGLRFEMIHDSGAYVPWGIIMPYIAVTTTPGPYVVPNIDLTLKVAYTNKVPTTPMRGAGRPQGVFAMERVLDKAAEELGIAPDEIRRRNLVQPGQMPYPVGFIYRDGKPVIYDSGDYPTCQAKALEIADWAGFKTRQAAARAEGRHIGMGIGNYVEGTGLGPFEGATVRVQQNGRVTVVCGAGAQGQGHKTIWTQICADLLGVSPQQIDVNIADTDAIAMGVGTFASRVTVNAGNSVNSAALAVRGKLLKLASHLLEASEEDLELVDARVQVKGIPGRHKSFADLARISQGMPGFSFPEGVSCGLEETVYFSPERSTYCNGTHIAEVEVDIQTGRVGIMRYSVAHDSGRLINPMLVDGQIQGGVAHGIGNALYERMAYDSQAQPITTTFADYTMPMATDVPAVHMTHIETPSPLNPLGVKGAGEGGTIPAAAAIIRAIEDALSPYGIKIEETPVLPQRLVAMLREAGAYQNR
jgi:aerobic carbon-monoxide dehydrogenase large subunit